MAIEWSEETFGTGDADIDAQHRQLFRRIDMLLDAITAKRGHDEIRHILDFLSGYVTFHFGFEENLMRRRQCLGCRRNELEHKAFSRDLEDLKRRFDLEGPSDDLLVDVEQRVSGWLFNHICRVDRPNLLAAKTAAAAP